MCDEPTFNNPFLIIKPLMYFGETSHKDHKMRKEWRMPTKDTNLGIFSPMPSFELHDDDNAANVCVIILHTGGFWQT